MDKTDMIACLAIIFLCGFLFSMDLNREIEVRMCTHHKVLTYVGRGPLPESIEGYLGKCEVKIMIKEEYYEINHIWRRIK